VGTVSLFDSDNDSCSVCGEWFPAVSATVEVPEKIDNLFRLYGIYNTFDNWGSCRGENFIAYFTSEELAEAYVKKHCLPEKKCSKDGCFDEDTELNGCVDYRIDQENRVEGEINPQ